MRLLRRVRTLSGLDWLALVGMVLLLPTMRLALAVFPFRMVKRFVLLTSETTSVQVQEKEYLARIAWAAGVIGRRLLGDKPCLTQALVVHWLLGRRGYETQLRIGVAKQKDAFKAHAWVEYGGRTIVGGWRSQHVYQSLTPIVIPGAKTESVKQGETGALL